MSLRSQFGQLGYREFVRKKVDAGERAARVRTYSSRQVIKQLKERIRTRAARS